VKVVCTKINLGWKGLMYGIDMSTSELEFTFLLPTLLPVYEFAAEAL